MAAILQTPGPVSTCEAVRSNWSRNSLGNTTVQQFERAALELEAVNLGMLVHVMNSTGRTSKVFIKKQPDEVEEALAANPNLCTPTVYYDRYHHPASKKISWALRTKLVELGLVTQKQFM